MNLVRGAHAMRIAPDGPGLCPCPSDAIKLAAENNMMTKRQSPKFMAFFIFSPLLGLILFFLLKQKVKKVKFIFRTQF